MNGLSKDAQSSFLDAQIDTEEFVELINNLPEKERERICFFVKGVLFAIQSAPSDQQTA